MNLFVFVDSDMFLVPPPEFESKDPVGFTWWILLHVAPLFGFDTQGNYDTKNIQVYLCLFTNCGYCLARGSFTKLDLINIKFQLNDKINKY